jgi:hypothetical protein
MQYLEYFKENTEVLHEVTSYDERAKAKKATPELSFIKKKIMKIRATHIHSFIKC